MESQGGGAARGTGTPGKTRARPEPDKRCTMADVARHSGVSQGAISSLLNGRAYGIRIGEKTRDRIFKSCRELGYVPNDLRAFVRMYPEQGGVAVLISSDLVNGVTDPFLSRVLKGAMGGLNGSSHMVTVARFDVEANYLDGPDELPPPVRAGTISKFLCVGAPNVSLCQALTRRGFPVVTIGREVSLPGVTSLVPDYVCAAKLAIGHLFELGHREIAILCGPFGTTCQETIELRSGVRLAFRAAGISVAPESLIYGDLTFRTGFEAVATILRRHPRPTAIFCLNDSSAAGVMAGALSHSLEVPAQLSVLSCGDDTFTECVHPSLSTVHLPAEEMGAVAIKEIERRIAQRDQGLGESRKMIFPVRLVERKSCSAPGADPRPHTAHQAAGIDT